MRSTLLKTKNSDLQRSIELQQFKQLHYKDSEIGILEMEQRYHVAEVKSLKEKVPIVLEKNLNLSLEYYQNLKVNGQKQGSTGMQGCLL